MSRKRYTDEEKARIIREFQQHDGTAADFCRQHKVSYRTFMKWRRRASAPQPHTDAAPEFLEFELGAAPDRQACAGPVVELAFGGDMVLRIFPPHARRP